MEGTFYCDFRRVSRPRLSPYKERRAAFPDSIRQTRAADQQLPVPVLLGDSPMKAIAGAKRIYQQLCDQCEGSGSQSHGTSRLV